LNSLDTSKINQVHGLIQEEKYDEADNIVFEGEVD